MKNILSFVAGRQPLVRAAFFTLTLGLGACNVTDVVPVDAVSETVAYADASHVALAVAGVYDAAQSGYYNGNNPAAGVRGYPFGAAANEQGDIRGEDVMDVAGFFAIVYQHTITTTSANIVYMWANCYSVIDKANVAIAGVQQAAASGIITAAAATEYEGELRFLRALAHMELVVNFSRPYTDGNGSNPGVPYRLLANNNVANIATSTTQGRGTVADDYTAMLADLDVAETNLPVSRPTATYPTATYGGAGSVTRATKGAAIALKQRLRLYQGNWAAAILEGNKLITGTTTFTSPSPFISGPTLPYSLLATQRAAFVAGAATYENIFSVENSSADNGGVNGALAAAYATTAIGGRSLIAISPNLYDASFFTCNDLRRTVMMQQVPALKIYVSAKYTDATTYTDFAPIIRYAEVLLNQAEALARTGNSTLALSMLNAVRNRSVTAVADQYAAGSLTGTSLVQAILNERRVEFVGEGLRWGDIARLSPEATYAPVANGGVPAKFLISQIALTNYSCATPSLLTGQSLKALPYTDYRFLWPIPSTETQTNPKLLAEQNPGY